MGAWHDVVSRKDQLFIHKYANLPYLGLRMGCQVESLQIFPAR